MGFCHFLYGALLALLWIGGRAQYTTCNGIAWKANGFCDWFNNNIECDYDGGDCCECTCFGGRQYPCGINGFDCLDPSASNVASECQNTASNSRICSTEDTVQDWVVNDTASVRAFAEAVNCTGGTFNVTWKGRVIIDRTIYVAPETTVNLTGADSGSEVDGGKSIRIFTLVDASLHVSGMVLSNGNATYGGAIAAVGSRITLNGTTFNNNIATSVAGAIYMENSTFIARGGQLTFATNVAGLRGGALVAERDSHISWNGPTLFLDNIAFDFAGALYIHDSVVSWSGETSFIGNMAGYNGGALIILDHSAVSWFAQTSFIDNSGEFGGAIYVEAYSNVSWTAETSFINNTAGHNGGALVVFDNSAVSWFAETSYINNSGEFGGAISVMAGSDVSWTAKTSFIRNAASYSGGALAIYLNSVVFWFAETSFINNHAAAGNGGALFADNGCNLWWDGSTSFTNNAANLSGGALLVINKSSVSWFTETSFTNNSGEFGGAIHVGANSNVTWTAETSFIKNIGGINGGALVVFDNSAVSWFAETSFINNSGEVGGAIYVRANSNVSWTAETSFMNNTASNFGGALLIFENSAVFWFAETLFINNNAVAESGGALHVEKECHIWWDRATSFIDNVANKSGGAIFIIYDSSLSWTAKSSFNNNIAGIHGGAIGVANGSSASWKAPATFFNNSASLYWGGAIMLYFNSGLFWESTTSFLSNTAGALGGALASLIGSTVTMAGQTFFLDNVAGTDGGAAYIYHNGGYGQSFLIINSSTVFRRNRCDANGGGMALIGSVSTELNTLNMSFSENVAGVAGGAVYVSGAIFGPKFDSTRFVSNSAEIGGGVHTTGSGIAVVPNILGVPEPQDPVTFISCEFINNKAVTRGGALDTGAGIDRIVNTLFEGNTAGTGGALRLAGEVSIEGCEFVENSSGEHKGPAVYNEGVISYMSNSRFVDNVFNCEVKHFFVFNESDVSLDTVCKDCDVCENCVFVGETPMCVEEIDHSTSPGGNTTVELLSIENGYWRVSNTSTKILECYNPKACKGGVTGDPQYCLKGYEGPYCSVCSDGHTPSIGSSCNKCSDTNGPGIALLAVFSVVAFVVCVAILNYMLSGQERSADRGIVARISHVIPMQSLKIIVVVWQILTQFCTVTNFSFPGIYQTFLDGVDLLNFDFSWVISTGCIVDIDFHDRLLISTLGPILGITILRATYTVAIYRHRGSETSCRVVRRKHLSMVLLLTFLVYSSVSTTVFAMFVCDELDDGTSYLRVDYRIDCDSSEHKALQIYAGFMIVLYAAGIPAFYASLLFSNRDTLTKDENREKKDSVTPFEHLWKPYKPRYFFYEVVECCRRVSLAGIVVFIYPDTAAQIAIALILAIAFFIFSEALAPYESSWDCLVSRMGHVLVFTSLFLALLLKVDVSDEGAKSQQMFEAVLITLHATMIVVVIIEGGAMIVTWKKDQVAEDPRPRPRV